MTWWERAYLFEILRGLGITGGVFLRNMWRWMTGRKGALTTYYPEETRADYAAGNRGKHILTQRPDGRPQCIACNMCATVCPAQVIEIDAGVRSRRPRASQVPVALRDRLLALHLLRAVRRGLPRGRDPHGEGSARPAVRATATTCGSRWTSSSPGIRRATSPSPTRRSATPASGGARMIEHLLQNLDALLLRVLRRRGAGRRGADARAAAPDAGRDGAHLDDGLPGRRSTACSACTSSRRSRC